ncbi:MAG: hypothetical protein E6J90_23540 [Deltaproteobacteria bacterium]|nr:MAG: hypothetical protein E6J91_42810 [Deltaproteobacteria bacterium]TMQ16578.1 MAG: hypothetical protein E6J90_23540 [Deltaproteobacteria bacterium]
MAKWLITGGVAILVALVVLLWLEMRPDEPAPVVHRSAAPAPQVAVVAAPVPVPVAPTAPAEAATAPAAEPQVPPGKLDPRSDEFFYKFDEVVPQRLTRNAARCYEGRHGSLHRNQKLSLRFKTRIVNGEVSIHDVTIKESTISDAALETCFLQEVQRSSWKDSQLPDWEQDDEVVLRPERGMKKFWKDNIDYVGAEAPRQ